VDAEPVSPSRLDDPVRRQHEHLRRDAADVEAGSPEPTALDETDVEVIHLRGDDGVARAGTDDDEVVVAVLHVAQSNFRRPARLLPRPRGWCGI